MFHWTVITALFITFYVMTFSLLQAVHVRRRGWKQYRQWMKRNENKSFDYLKRMFHIRPSDHYAELKQLLQSAGIPIPIDTYFILKRSVGLVCVTAALISVGSMQTERFTTDACLFTLAFFICIGFVLLCDKTIFETIKKVRTRKIINEIYMLSRQLLYYDRSKMNLHAKLTRCAPHARVLKKELQWLLREWYEDPERAIQRFKQRIGTEEGYSFAETLNAIRLNDSEYYYDLLRQRIGDYKEKIELYRESRKETTSYILFVLAGIPILNTFRVFIFPWVAEGQKLLNMLS